MKPKERQEVLLLSLESRWLLQEVEHRWAEGDIRARGLLNDIYAHRPISYEVLHPVLRRPSMLPFLFISAALCRQFEDDQLVNAGIAYSDSWDIEFVEEGVVNSSPTPSQIVRFIRNALAHMFDTIAPDGWEPVATSPEPLVFRSARTGSKSRFRTEAGIVAFLKDFMRSARKLSA